MSRSELLEREAETRRLQLAETFDELRASVTPGHMLDRLVDYATDSGSVDFFRNLRNQALANPLALGLVGVGLAWLVLSSGRRVIYDPHQAYDPYDPEASHERSHASASHIHGQPLHDQPHAPHDHPHARSYFASSRERAGDAMGAMSGAMSSARHFMGDAASGAGHLVGDAASGAGHLVSDAASGAGQYVASGACALAGSAASGAAALAGTAATGAYHLAGNAASGASQFVGDAACDVRDRVSDAAQFVSDAAGSAAGTLASGARSAGEAAYGTASSLGGQACAHASNTATALYGGVADTAGRTAQGMRSVASGTAATGRDVVDFCRDHPLVLAGLGVALGVIAGAALPATETEGELMGEASDELRRRGRSFAAENYEKSMSVAESMLGEFRGMGSEEVPGAAREEAGMSGSSGMSSSGGMSSGMSSSGMSSSSPGSSSSGGAASGGSSPQHAPLSTEISTEMEHGIPGSRPGEPRDR